MSRVRIIGVGTPFGDDRAGLEIAARLLAAPPRDYEVVATARPGVELIDLFVGADAVILLDAVRSGAAPGTIHDLPLDALPHPCVAVSSHGVSIAATLALAAALGRMPRGRLVGVEGGRGSDAIDAPFSASVAAALSPAAMRAHAWAERYRHGDRTGDAEGGSR